MLTSELLFWHAHAVAMRARQEHEPTRCDWLAKLEYGTIFELESRDPSPHSPTLSYAKTREMQE